MSSRLTKNVHWWPTGNPCRPWAVVFEGDDLEIAVHETPGGERYQSLIVNGEKDVDFVEWPATWTVAPDNGGNASQRAEYEHEGEKIEKNKGVKPLAE